VASGHRHQNINISQDLRKRVRKKKKDIGKNEICSASIVLFNLNSSVRVSVTA
jgi:hypothetical protein